MLLRANLLFAVSAIMCACTHTPVDAWLPDPRSRVEYVLVGSALPFPREDVLAALEAAADEIRSLSMIGAVVVSVSAPRGPDSRRCFIQFVAPATGRYSPYIPDDLVAWADITDGDTCTVWIRSVDMVSPNYLGNTLRHELWHTILGHYHNNDPRSIMYPDIRRGMYFFTPEDQKFLNNHISD